MIQASRGLHELHRLLVVGHVEADLGKPPFLQRYHLFQEFVKPVEVAGRVVIPELDELSVHPGEVRPGRLVPDLFDDFVDRALEVSTAVDTPDRAEGAGVCAPAGSDNRRAGVVLAGVEKVKAAEWNSVEGVYGNGVSAFHRSRPVPGNDGVEEFPDAGVDTAGQRCVRTAQECRGASILQTPRNFEDVVSLCHGRGEEGNVGNRS
jgi:hypothetical protein